MKVETQINLFDISLPVPVAPSPVPQTSNDPDAFGCCSRFRSCSDAKRCLISHLDYSAHCSYRKNLENGAIFYGKNANGFSSAVYVEYCQRVKALSDDVRGECYRLLTYFFETKPGSRRVLVDNAPWIQSLADIGLFSVAPCHDYLLSVCGYRELLNRLKADPVYGPKWAARNDSDRTKSALVEWIKKSAVPFLDHLADPYRMIEICDPAQIYATELYHDFLFCRSSGYIMDQPPLMRDGLIGKGA